jgi:flagella basal body P-ring formation protein FlgA
MKNSQRYSGAMVFSFGALMALSNSAIATAQQNPRQSLEVLKERVELFLTDRTREISGDVVISVAPFDSRLSLGHCSALDVFFSGNSRAWGRTSVGIRCMSPVRWTIFVQANVSVLGEYVIATTAMQLGQKISARDVAVERGDLTVLPSGAALQPSDVVNRIAKQSIKPGAIMKADMITLPLVIQQGNKIRIFSRGEGFSLSTDGVALNSAANGEPVRARVQSGQVIQGIARESGQIEVKFK